nr:hypothetical protein [Mycoplasmopsis cynos]
MFWRNSNGVYFSSFDFPSSAVFIFFVELINHLTNALVASSSASLALTPINDGPWT